MSTDRVTVQFSHPHQGHAVGDRVDLTAEDARRLVRAGIVVYATGKPAGPSASAAPADPAAAEPRATASKTTKG